MPTRVCLLCTQYDCLASNLFHVFWILLLYCNSNSKEIKRFNKERPPCLCHLTQTEALKIRFNNVKKVGWGVCVRRRGSVKTNKMEQLHVTVVPSKGGGDSFSGI